MSKNIFFSPCSKTFGPMDQKINFSKMQFLARNLTIKIESLRNFLSKNVYFHFLYLVSFQVTTKTIFTKHYKIVRVAPSLTLKWSRYFWLPLVVKVGSLWTLTQKSTFPIEFCTQIHTTDKAVQKNQSRIKKSKIRFKITKWRPTI